MHAGQGALCPGCPQQVQAGGLSQGALQDTPLSAGASATSLAGVPSQQEAGGAERRSLQELPLLTADVQDKQSLRDIAAQTTVILSTAGPFAKLGPPVVEACVAEQTHYCDLTGGGWQHVLCRARVRLLCP